ncbi:MAG: IMP dehydrogenase, partial [Psychrosphaera sp.]|nr:IMP dehydrogenase [Psychrosphaera sp.]
MRVETEIKLGFKDVLIRPKRSTLKSRSQVCLQRSFKLKHSDSQWTGVPVIAANMDTVGTFAMARVLAEHQMLTAIHKHYSIEQWQAFLQQPDITNNIMVSSGTSDGDVEKLKTIMSL